MEMDTGCCFLSVGHLDLYVLFLADHILSVTWIGTELGLYRVALSQHLRHTLMRLGKQLVLCVAFL